MDKSGTCDTNEPLSTLSNTNGEFSFDGELESGSHVIIQTQGDHDGIPFDLDIAGVVGEDGDLVVSPLTTFQTKDLTAAQLVEILTKAANDAGVGSYYNFDETTIFDDPLAGGLMDRSISDISDSDLSNIRASLASYGLLKIMKGSDTLDSLVGIELYQSGITTGSAVNLIAQNLLEHVAQGLNVDLLETIKTGVDSGRSALENGFVAVMGQVPVMNNGDTIGEAAMPDVKVGLVVKVATKIINDLAKVGYETCNATEGNYVTKVTAALEAVGLRATNTTQSDKLISLGTSLYAFENKSSIESSLSGNYSAGLIALKAADTNLKTGLEAPNGATTFYFDDSGSVQAYTGE